MANQQIAPMAQLSINERIDELENFLRIQEEKLAQPKETLPMAPPMTPEITPVIPQTDDVLTLLKRISENQEIDRKRYERNNPVSGDDPIYDWAEETILPGQMVQFIYYVPEGRAFFLEYINVVHNVETTYSIFIDGEYQPNLSYALQDFGDHMEIWRPPKMAYNKVEVWCLNNWIAAQTYSVFFQGFNRFYRKIHREIKYEFLEKEKTEEP